MNVNVATQLDEIVLAARAAANALRDEHEGDFTGYVDRLVTLTTELDNLVHHW